MYQINYWGFNERSELDYEHYLYCIRYYYSSSDRQIFKYIENDITESFSNLEWVKRQRTREIFTTDWQRNKDGELDQLLNFFKLTKGKT